MPKLKRLEKLVKMLDNIRDDNFEMSSWATYREPGEEKFECGTAYCVCGWAAHLKIFKNFTIDNAPCPTMTLKTGDCGRYIDWDAVCHLFDLTESVAEFLFMDGEYDPETFPSTRLNVQKRLKDFIKMHKLARKLGYDELTHVSEIR